MSSGLPTLPVQTERIMCVFAARRSGQHAIIWWLRSITGQPHERLNNCGFPCNVGRRLEAWRACADQPALRAIYVNFEDKCPSMVAALLDQDQPLFVGLEARQTTFLLVLRDPFNHLASKRKANPERSLEYGRAEAELWKAHAREYLSETSYLPNKTVVNYNSWFSEPAYRAQLAEELRMDLPGHSEVAETALQEVPGTGQSQFDGRRFHRRAQEMDVLGRWRHRLDDSIFMTLIRDREIWDLYERIFNVAGIDDLKRRVFGTCMLR